MKEVENESRKMGLDILNKLNTVDSGVVHTTGNETIAGTKTFTSSIVGNVTGDVSGTATNAINLTGSGTVSATTTGGDALTPTNATNSTNATNLIGSGTVSATTTGGAGLTPTNATNATTVGGLSATVLAPIGSITMFGGATVPPSGWLTCDGSAVNRTTYSALFAVISTTWGAGNGSTTFNLPDMRGAAPAGVGTSTGYTQNETLVLATKYNDQFQGHWHNVIYGVVTGSAGSFIRGAAQDGNTNAINTVVTDGTSGNPRTGTTTRGKRIGVNFIIKY
jgi:microcystin-dependent protein